MCGSLLVPSSVVTLPSCEHFLCAGGCKSRGAKSLMGGSRMEPLGAGRDVRLAVHHGASGVVAREQGHGYGRKGGPKQRSPGAVSG